MSYKLESHRILAGSLNLLPPGDKIPEGDCLELCNFRMDQLGVLRSRKGVQQAPPNFGETVFADTHSFGRRGNLMYVGAGPSVYRNGNTPSITDAGDGNPFWFAAMNDAMWIMNRGVQGSDDGSTFSTWGIEAPNVAPLPYDLSQPGNLTGQYQWYVTYGTDGDADESNPGPASDPTQTITNAEAVLTIPVSADPKVTVRNLYRSGGTLGQAYRVLQVNDNTTTSVIDNLSDADATTEGIALEANHDQPPAASGIVGPYFSRLLAWSSEEYPNRMWWTKPDQPGFWPGAADQDSGTGQWVDVGDDDEAILRITCHTRVAIIYKERSIWRLIGDPDTGTLEQTKSKVGILGSRAVVNGGDVDYFASVDGVFSFDMDKPTKLTPRLDPIFQGAGTEIAPGIFVNGIDFGARANCAMELVNGIVYLAYPQAAGTPTLTSATLQYHVASDRWGRAQYFTNTGAFLSFFYPVGVQDFWAGGPAGLGVAILDQGTTDEGNPILLAFQSGYYNQGAPDNDKVYTGLVIEFQAQAGDNVTVFTFFNSAAGLEGDGAIGSLIGSGGRQTADFEIGSDHEGLLARSISVRLECAAMQEVLIHSITLYYYVEARLATIVNTIPLDLGTNKVKQIRELQLDIDTSNGTASADVSTDLPGNQIAVRDTRAIAGSDGRRNFQLPLAATYEGRLLQLSVYSPNAFRLYAARLLMRLVGVYVEDYEAAAGYLWDSQEHDFSSHITHIPRTALISLHENPVKRARELEVELETRSGTVRVSLMTDLPGNVMTVRYTTQVTANSGHRVVRLPLPAGIEGRLFRLQLSGTSTYLLYGARLEILPIGVYLEAYEAAGGAVWDSREQDFGSEKVKDARELQLDIETTGAVAVNLYGDNHGAMALRFTASVNTQLTTPGRRKLNLALTTTGQSPELDARLWQLVITGSNAFRLYGAALHVRAIGHYIDTDAATGAALYDSTALALSPGVKQFRTIEVELHTLGPVTIAFLCDLPANSLTSRVSQVVDTSASGRRTFQIPLPQGAVPDNFNFGKLMQLTIAGTSAYKLFSARVEFRTVGTYVEAYEAAGGAVWDSSPLDLGVPQDKIFDELRLEMDADGACQVTVWTDLPGETLTERFTTQISTSGFGRRWVTMVLPADTQGRMIKVVVSSSQAFRLYQGQVSKRIVGRYLSAQQNDIYRSLDQDFETERVKLFKRLEVDIQTDGPVPLTLYTDQPGGTSMARYTAVLSTGGSRQAVSLRLPGNIRGRIVRVEIGGGYYSARLYGVRAWSKTVGESSTSSWDWVSFPVEPSSSLAEWAALPVEATPAEWQWADLPVEKTEAVWSWAPFPVLATAQWDWAVFPVDDTPSEWSWVDVPVGQE